MNADLDDWDRHWEDYADSAVVNPAQEYRRTFVLAHLDLEGAACPRVLDLGSGLGDFLCAVHAYRPSVPSLGLELSRRGVDAARRRLPGATFLQRDLIAGHDDPAEYRGFATHAVCSEVLEHVDDPVRFLQNARPYMADGCKLIVTVPGGPRSAYDRHIGHRRHFTPADLRRVLVDAGFTVELATGAGFPFFNLYRVAVLLRGRQLVDDARGRPGVAISVLSRIFRFLFRFNLRSSPYGWQTVAVART